MKKLLAALLLLCSATVFAGFPVFIGDQNSYISNSATAGTANGFWTIVISNKVVAKIVGANNDFTIVTRGDGSAGHLRITNGTSALSIPYMSFDCGDGSLNSGIGWNFANNLSWVALITSNEFSIASQSGLEPFHAHSDETFLHLPTVMYGRNAAWSTNEATNNIIMSVRDEFAGLAVRQSNIVNFVNYFLGSTNSTANTNLTIDFNQPVVDLYLTNNASISNFVNVPASNYSALVTWRVTPRGKNRTVTYGALGQAQFSVFCETNSGSTMWTTLTQDVHYRLTWDAIGTNIATTITAWQ